NPGGKGGLGRCCCGTTEREYTRLMKIDIRLMVLAAALSPAASLAQSSVTISGYFKGGFEGLRYANSAKANKSQTGVVDDLSRLYINVVEDLGGGMQAIGQYELRLKLDDTQGAAQADAPNVGNSHVGLRSKSWGRIFVGRQDLHYMLTESDISNKASLRANTQSILSFAGGGGQAIAGTTRTQNVVHYTTPDWGGFT